MVLSAFGSIVAVAPANALTFNFIAGDGITYDPLTGVSQQLTGFTEAGNLWSTFFTDPVTINIRINFRDLGDPSLRSLGGTDYLAAQNFSYTDVYNALNADKKSADDNTAVASLSLPSNSNGTYQKWTNYTSDNPDLINNKTAYLASGNTIAMTTANAKALGLIDATNTSLDATISLNNRYTWDYVTPIGASNYDFVGVAAHEIGHALGFNSAVDALDSSGGANPASYYRLVPLDLFRYSTASTAQHAVDFTVGTEDKYFSIDGGTTKIASFSTGVYNGDRYQAQHWQEVSTTLGIMDPVTLAGEFLKFTKNDVRAFDVVGWDCAARYCPPLTAVPEPENYLGTFIFVAFGVRTIVKHKRNLAKSIDPAAR